MEFLYPFFIAFVMVFIAELGDKTQLIVLSFSNSLKVRTILLGVFLGSLFSHGIAVLFGSSLGVFSNSYWRAFIEFLTYSSFILIGIFSLLSVKEDSDSKKDGLIKKISNFKLNYCLIIALSIIIGELGDKTFLASVGFGIQYPNAKLLLILGSTCGMVFSNLIAIALGKFLNNFISEKTMQKLSGILFLVFGIAGFIF